MKFFRVFKKETVVTEMIDTSFSVKNKIKVKSLQRSIPIDIRMASRSSISIDIQDSYSPCKSRKYSSFPSDIKSISTSLLTEK